MLRPYTFNLTAAGGAKPADRLDVSGPVVAVLEATVPFRLQLDNGTPIVADRGLKFRFPFSSIYVENVSTSANVVTLLIGDGDFDDYRPQIRTEIASTSRVLWNNNALTGMTAETAQLIEAANPYRVEVLCHAEPLNAGNVTLQSAAAAGRGIQVLAPGEKFRINYRGPVYGRSTNGTDSITVIITEYI